jgi:hypothetical protein
MDGTVTVGSGASAITFYNTGTTCYVANHNGYKLEKMKKLSREEIVSQETTGGKIYIRLIAKMEIVCIN